jgi:hypothetical protein
LAAKDSRLNPLFNSEATVSVVLFRQVPLWKQNRRVCLLVLLVILYFIVVTSGPESYRRYRVPFLPYLVLLAVSCDAVIAAATGLAHRRRTSLSRQGNPI